MKRIFFLFTACVICAASLHSQQPPAPEVPLTPIEQLRAIRDQNAKLLEQQAKTLLQLEEMEKTAQSLKVLGKRS